MDGAAKEDEHWDLFEDVEAEVRFAPMPRTLAFQDGWSVIEAELPQEGAARWMTCEGAFSLDQTRVHLRSDQSFRRDQLRAASHQVMALAVALACRPGEPCSVVVLGGGGMALPMALLANASAQLSLQVVELHAAVIDFARRFFGASHERLGVHQADALQWVLGGQMASCDVLLVDIDFLRGEGGDDGGEEDGVFTSREFWDAVWSQTKSL
ncbi:unnamed protein product, partial [Effrenium voratum]